MLIDNVTAIGQLVRERRTEARLTIRSFAAAAGVGTRFISELENGKESCEIGLVLRVLNHLGIGLHANAGDWHPAPQSESDVDELNVPDRGGALDFEFGEDEGGFRP